MNLWCLYLCYGYDMLLGTCMYNVLLEAIWWYYIGYDEYEYDVQMVDSEKWWIVLSMRMLDDNPKHDVHDVLHVSQIENHVIDMNVLHWTLAYDLKDCNCWC